MEDNKELVLDGTENIEQATEELVDGAKVVEEVDNIENSDTKTTEEQQTTTEEVEKIYSKQDLSERIDKAVRRREAKIRREYEEKYGELENVLKAGTGESDLKTITDTFTDFYTKKGINIPKYAYENEYDMQAGAEKYANELIDSDSFDEIVFETDRLAELGLDNMTSRDKIVFKKLAEYRQTKERENELASIGAMKVANDKDFNEFASQFNSNVPITKVYEMYSKIKPKPEVEQIGSMKQNTVPNKVKDYYTPDEARRLTEKDLDDPNVMKAVEKSMAIWYEKGIK